MDWVRIKNQIGEYDRENTLIRILYMPPPTDDEERSYRARVDSDIQAWRDAEQKIRQNNYEAFGQFILSGAIVTITAFFADLKWTIVAAVWVVTFSLSFQISLLNALVIRTHQMHMLIRSRWPISRRVDCRSQRHRP